MSAPERIWAASVTENYGEWQTTTDGLPRPTEYVRADIVTARIAALEAQLAERVKDEPAAFLVERIAGSGYGRARKVIDAAIYDPRRDDFWIGDGKKNHLVTPLYALSAIEATPPAPKVTEIVWHRLIDGDPEKTGRYIVGHRGMSAPATYHDDGPIKGWDRSVEAFTHWAIEPRAPDDGTPQLFKPEGQRLRQEALEIASWNALTAAQEAGKP